MLYSGFWNKKILIFREGQVKLQQILDEKCKLAKVNVPPKRKGSQLAISLFCDIFLGVHPVEALLSANLDIIPRVKG